MIVIVKYDVGGCLSTEVDTPEEAIAYTEEVVKDLFAKNDLVITPSIYDGSWCGREKFFTHQDLIIAEKSRSN